MLQTLSALAIGLAIFAILALFVYAHLTAKPADLRRYPGEEAFLTNVPVPATESQASIYISLIVPAYKEASRLPVMMEETMAYLLQRKEADSSFSFEVIIVDDGSPDSTSEVAVKYTKQYGANLVRVLKLHHNRGKGGAVRMGMLSARGKYVLMVDADGATKISDLSKLEDQMQRIQRNNQGIVVGSRAHLVDDAVAERSFLRNILMHAFHLLVYVMCVRGIKDTQCGFKLFTRETAHRLFSVIHVERWAFDVEVLFVAQALGIPIAEVAVNWQEIDGSKLDPLTGAIQMGRDIVFIRMFYLCRAWSYALPLKSA